ncbi:hypothetical protein [Streptomyces sp. SID14515]|uniref:hypothetical protein n=1 Tax=Streptomyces sp. SID14515 TaxID=2706074 RepID=UPI0013CC472C|nr:hypothetical protein [Streptomyces sp. SID14515]NEB40173.1 hypothetical protein [Streptomyces sp. SID14515]
MTARSLLTPDLPARCTTPDLPGACAPAIPPPTAASDGRGRPARTGGRRPGDPGGEHREEDGDAREAP